MQRRILRAALSEASGPVLRSARELAPVRQPVHNRSTKIRARGLRKAGVKLTGGTTRRSLGRKIKTSAKTGTVVVTIGARRGYRVMVRKGNKTVPHDPVRIIHLLEKGHKIVRGGSLKHGGRVVGMAAPHPFLAPAVALNQAQVIVTVARRIGDEVEKEARK